MIIGPDSFVLPNCSLMHKPLFLFGSSKTRWQVFGGERREKGSEAVAHVSVARLGNGVAVEDGREWGEGVQLFFVAVVASLPMAPRTAASLCASPLQVPIHGRQGVNVN